MPLPFPRSRAIIRSACVIAIASLTVGNAASAQVGRDTTARTSDSVQVLKTLEVTATPRPGYDELLTSSATKTPTLLRNVPQSVTVVSRELIADQGMRSMADVARYVPGVTAVVRPLPLAHGRSNVVCPAVSRTLAAPAWAQETIAPVPSLSIDHVAAKPRPFVLSPPT